jgi:SAM-dependent methyltransferase
VPASYEVTAEFYDVLHASSYVRITEGLLDRWLGSPAVGVIDVGAGTGLGTFLLAERSDVPVHAVEPAAPMRAVLLSRLAGKPELLSRVHLHTCPAQDLPLVGAADFALCCNTMGTLPAESRTEVLAALARALVPGGRLVVERPPTSPTPTVHQLPSWRLGDEVYGGSVSVDDNGDATLTWRFEYEVTNADVVVRSAHESFTGYVVAADEFEASVTEAGFDIEDIKGDVVSAIRRAGPRR